jgi:hypothetical protein
MTIKRAANIFIVVLWFATAIIGTIWVFNIKFPYEPEPLTVMLGLISAGVTGIVNRYSYQLEKEKFTVANVLAKGYVKNFVEPVLTELIKVGAKTGVKPTLYIFIPNLLSELTPKSIDRLKVKITEKGLLEKTERVKLSEGRGVRDVLSISNTQKENVFFDFPNTIYSLTDFVNFKQNSPKDSLDNDLKNKLGHKYIEHFKEQLIESLTDKQLYPEYVKLTNCDLNIDL